MNDHTYRRSVMKYVIAIVAILFATATAASASTDDNGTDAGKTTWYFCVQTPDGGHFTDTVKAFDKGGWHYRQKKQELEAQYGAENVTNGPCIPHEIVPHGISHLGTCLTSGQFAELSDSPAADGLVDGWQVASVANYLEGVGITCDATAGYTATGALVDGNGDPGTGGVYPYYTKNA